MNRKTLWYKQPAHSWNEALPLGNGRIGAMVWSGIGQERFSLNEETVWSGHPDSCGGQFDMETVGRIRELVAERRFSEAEETAASVMSRPDTASYLPAGELAIDLFEQNGYWQVERYETEGYYRSLDLSRAVAETHYRLGNHTYHTTSFASHPQNVLVYHVESDGPLAMNIRLNSWYQVESRREQGNNDLILLARCDYDYPEGVGYIIRLRVIGEGEEKKTPDLKRMYGGLRVRVCKRATVLLTIATSVSRKARGRNTSSAAVRCWILPRRLVTRGCFPHTLPTTVRFSTAFRCGSDRAAICRPMSGSASTQMTPSWQSSSLTSGAIF